MRGQRGEAGGGPEAKREATLGKGHGRGNEEKHIGWDFGGREGRAGSKRQVGGKPEDTQRLLPGRLSKLETCRSKTVKKNNNFFPK